MHQPGEYSPENKCQQHIDHSRIQQMPQDDRTCSCGEWGTTDPIHWWMNEYESQSDSDSDRPEPDVVLDDLASRRFRSPSPAAPTNYAIPLSPIRTRGVGEVSRQQVAIRQTPLQQSLTYLRGASPTTPDGVLRTPLEDVQLRAELYEDSEDEEGEGEAGYADPVHDDLYTRKVALQSPKSLPYDKFLPKFWTPDEEAHVHQIKLGSQRRPWYKKMQGLRKTSGSSSDDSDCDVTPWLGRPSSARP